MQESRVIGAAVDNLKVLSRGERAATDEPSPCELAQYAELQQFVQALQICLSQRQRTLLFLRYHSERTFGEIAVIFEISDEAVRMMHMRALRRLKQESTAL